MTSRAVSLQDLTSERQRRNSAVLAGAIVIGAALLNGATLPHTTTPGGLLP